MRGVRIMVQNALMDPVDFIVFDGMNDSREEGKPELFKRILLLDRPTKQPRRRKVQKSLARTIKRGDYSWKTVRVGKDGRVE